MKIYLSSKGNVLVIYQQVSLTGDSKIKNIDYMIQIRILFILLKDHILVELVFHKQL